jgi:hypothetical protein
MEARFFTRKAGEPVPEVDPDDVKAIWAVHEDAARRHPGEQVGIGETVLQHACKPGADIAAVAYRAGMLGLVVQHGDTRIAAGIDNGQPGDALFRAAALTPMEWLGEGLHQSWPFDMDEFLRRAGGEIA